MTDTNIAYRYAQALFLLGEEKGKTDAFLSQLDGIGETLNRVPGLKEVLNSKLIAFEKKKALLSQLFAEDTDTEVQNFLNIILDKGREDAISDIIVAYQALVDEKNSVVCVKVLTAAELSKEQLDALAVSVKARTGKDPRFETEIDESLIGGVKLVIGDLIYDASVTGQLTAMKQQLLR